MSAEEGKSFLTRPPKLPPLVAVSFGVVCIPIGLTLKGALGGALLGGGIAAVPMGIWDFARLRFVDWRRTRRARGADQG